MPVADRLRYDWKDDLRSLLGSVQRSLVISSPYVTSRGADFLISHVRDSVKPAISFSLLTDLSPLNVAHAATDPCAIRVIAESFSQARIFHLPRVHAKVYVQDAEHAIVSSGNLTAGGLDLNYEYGLNIVDPDLSRSIDQDIADYAQLGAVVPLDVLRIYGEKANELQTLYREQERAVRRADRRLRQALSAAADDLTRLRLAHGPMHTLFAATILYLLAKHGPMRTTELHPRIERTHPDLCDNSVDRVIDGKRFGKKWKHAVRTAQQQLKKRQKIRLVDDRWVLA